MDTLKLDKWAELLLDTGKRNNLVNFRDANAFTAEVLLPRAEDLFERVDGATSFEVYDPKISETEVDELQEEEVFAGTPASPANGDDTGEEDEGARDAYLERYSKCKRSQKQLLLYCAKASPIAAVKNIDKRARGFLEETGVNVAYMAFGFIHWKESDSSSKTYRAPILLVPIQLSQESAVSPYVIQSTGDEIIVNPTFSYKMDTDEGVKLPEYEDEGLGVYLEKVKGLVEKLGWAVTGECKIGIFSFQKINMYRDLKDNAAKILVNKNVRVLLGEPAEDGEEVDMGAVPVSNPLIELHSVVDADSSQIEAIEMAKSGKSFVLQGPPGTGKSQTITNIIAECLSDGKKVLFVSEKLAALNVVYDKLKHAGLAEFCLQLHSQKASKKEVIADICHTLRAEKSAVSQKAEAEVAAKEKAQRQLDEYASELHEKRPVIEMSLYQLYEAYSGLRAMPDVEYPMPGLSGKGAEYLAEVTSLLEQYVEFVPSIGYDYKRNPWRGFLPQDTSYQAKVEVRESISSVVELIRGLLPLQREFQGRYGTSFGSLEEAADWNAFFEFAATSDFITPSLLDRANFDTADAVMKTLQMQGEEILSIRSELDVAFEEEVYQLDGKDILDKLKSQFSRSFSRIFNGEYKRIIKAIRACRKDGKKPSYEDAVSTAEKLSTYQEKCARFAEAEEPVEAFFGVSYRGVDTDWQVANDDMAVLGEFFSKRIPLESLQQGGGIASMRELQLEVAGRLRDVLLSCDEGERKRAAGLFDRKEFDILSEPFDQVLHRLEDCLNCIDKLDDWHHFRTVFAKLGEMQASGFLEVAISQNVEPGRMVGAFQKQFYYQWIETILSGSAVLSSFRRVSQERAVRAFAEKDAEQFEINKARIRAALSSMRPSLDVIAPGSALAALLREGEKKRRQKGIRTLLSETGDLVQRIKPCFLMSPLSISTFLAPDAVHFDVVIFDEASQIFPQDAIGAIYRADQLIVVGDSKQMPPSNFFNASVEAGDDDEEIGDVADFESILDLCSASMRQLRLRWHYRSRYEQLISFSNRNFYDGDLVTFPSPKADVPGVGVDYYHVDGFFDRKSHTNRKEAEFVVDLVYRNLEEHPDRSLGVVAFSIAQQNLIDRLLSKRRQVEMEKDSFFRNDVNEPFFVKNLETVQGDERDTIIFSTAYGIDAQGRLLHNFGPLNRVGGERRLNVAVTRAKCNVQLVSSMHHTDIDLSRTSAEGARLLREYLDYAENGEIALERSIFVSPYERYDSEFEMEVCAFLRSNGFSVDTQVGCSGFRIDLGLKRADSSDYVLAIECDGATYHSSKNARDRDRLRQEILEHMGWRFYRVWSTDWFRNREEEQSRLLEVAREAVRGPVPEVAKSMPTRSAETFEEVAKEEVFSFPPYRVADVQGLANRYLPNDFQGMVRAILEKEAPLSEELLLRRIVWCFGREKVTSVVHREYEKKMARCQRRGIIRRGGFLYLNGGGELLFRVPGELKRDLKEIAPEELAAGMYAIMKQNVTVDRSGLYRTLAEQCGFSRVGKASSEMMDAALLLLSDRILVDGEQVSLR